MRGQVALQAEVLAGGDETGAEDLGPESVDHDAGGERMARIGKPASEAQTVLGQGFVPREDTGRHAGFARLAQVRLVVLAARQHVRLRSQGRVLHREKRRRRLLMRRQGLTGFPQMAPGGGVGWVEAKLGMFGQHGRRQGRRIDAMEDGHFRGGQGLAPELDLVEAAVTESGIPRT